MHFNFDGKGKGKREEVEKRGQRALRGKKFGEGETDGKQRRLRERKGGQRTRGVGEGSYGSSGRKRRAVEGGR